LPAALFQIPTLKQLRLDSNHLTSLPDLLSEPHKSKLIYLSLSYNNLTALPDWVYFFTRVSLEKLDLSFNQPGFKEVPESFGNLECLKVLHMQGNQIQSLPCTIAKVSKVEEFSLEWWPYVTYLFEGGGPQAAFKRQDVLRDDSIVTNRQVLRQIFEAIKLVN
jgi:Leucine-rich repeat (LRR) protein